MSFPKLVQVHWCARSGPGLSGGLSPEVAVGSEGLTAAGLLVGGAVFLLPL